MKLIVIIISVFIVISCSEVGNAPQVEPETVCDSFINIVSEDQFNTPDDADFNIENVVINQDCLNISIVDSGCNADNWEVNLLTTSSVMESNPVQKALKVRLINDQACLAVFQKTKTFDLTPIQIEAENEIILDIEGWSTSVNYTY